jgi:protein O-mannosyl-transferase
LFIQHLAQVKKNTTQKQVSVKKTVKPKPVEVTTGHPARKYLYPAIIFLLCLLLYGNTFNSDYTEDDGIYTKDNTLIKTGFSDVKYLFTKGTMYGCNGTNGYQYRPLPLLTFMAETSIFGLSPQISQRFNVFYFALCCIVVFIFFQKIFRSYNHAIPIAATLLFIFHPIHTDPVANYKSRDEILALMFGLLTLYWILDYVEKKKLQDLTLSIVAFICSLLCKETSICYLGIIPIFLYFFTSTGWNRIMKLTLPFAGVIVVYLFVHQKIFGSLTSNETMTIVNNSLMAAKSKMDMYATNFVMLGKYLCLLFVPYPLSWDYSFPQFPIVSWANAEALASLFIYIVMGVLIIMGFKKKSIYSFSMLFYLATLFLASNLVLKIACSFGERFLFSPSIGFCMAMPVLLASALKLKPSEKTGQKVKTYYGIVGVVLVIYAFILIPRNSDWKNDYTLFESGVKTSPNSGRTHGALASMYMDTAQNAKDPAKSKLFYSMAAHEFKRVTQLFTMDPDGYYNLGVCYYSDGSQDSAIMAYKKTLELNGKYALAANNLGVIYFNRKQYDTAIIYFGIAYKADPTNSDGLMNIGASYQNKGEYNLAFHYDSLVLKQSPNNRSTLSNLSIMHNEIGMQYVNNNQFDKALSEFMIASKCDSSSANAIGNMGVVYQKMGNIEKAKYCFQKALAKAPNDEVFMKDLQALNGGPK